jgi:cytochrome P450/nitrite reductase/ring-hydroxylating ferredoxin subunit
MAMTKGSVTPQAGGHGPGWRVVGKAAAILADQPCAAAIDGVELVLVQSSAGLRAYEARCPHQGTLLSEGDIVGGELVCRAHGWRFDVATGERKDAVPRACLRAHAVKTEGADVLVRLEREQPSNTLLDTTRAKRTLEDLPGPRGWPIFGNALQIDVQRVHCILEDWAREYGRIFKLTVMGKPAIVISDAELAESLLRARPKLFRRSGAIEPVFAEMGTAGVFSAEGDAWRAQRRLAMQALSNRHLRTFFPTLRRVTERLRARWANAATAGEPIDIDDDLMRFTVDATTSLVFSTDMDTLGSGDDVLQRQLSLVFPAFARRLLATVPYWRFIRLPSDRALDRALAEIRTVQERLVGETRARLAARAAGDDEPRDFIEAMLLARDEDGQPFGDDVVYGNMMTMLLAGEDTTAHSLAWVVHHLCDHQQVVARMRSEVDAALGHERTPGDFEKAQRMPYLDAVASETMRLSPVAPFLGLETNEEMVIDDILVPKGTWVDLMTRLPALDDANFGEAQQFRPERWLEERPQGCPHVPGASMPFGSGPRICPGRSLALLEMRVVLATLVRNFDFERVGAAENVHEHFAFTMSPRGLRVRLRERQAS